MKLSEMKTYLAAHGVEEGSAYSHGGVGGGEIHGIEEIDGVWYTYYSERGSKTGYRARPSEQEAVAHVLQDAEKHARAYKFWQDDATYKSPDKVHAFFARHGLKDREDYVLNGLRPEGHPRDFVPGLEFYGKFWQTYYARTNEKSAVRGRASFDVAAQWVIEMANAN